MIKKQIGRLLLAAALFALALANSGYQPTGASAPFVGAQGQRFIDPGGQPFFALGVNYVGRGDRAWAIWNDDRFDPIVIEQDFAKAKGSGANVVRIFVHPALQKDIDADRWNKLDTAVSLARKQGLRLLITLYDYREDDLNKVSRAAAAVARRYASEATVFGYDLKNEPHLSDLLNAQYPSPPPLFTNALIAAYGERMTQDRVNSWRASDEGRPIIPTRMAPKDAYYAANAYYIYREFVAASGAWVTARNYAVSTLDYLASPEAARWRTLLDVLNGTLAAWLAPQLAALRAADPAHLVTIGYNDPVLAHMPANASLGFVSMHRYPNAGAKPIQVAAETLRQLQNVFPAKPLLLGEFGYADNALGRPLAAANESAFLLSAWKGGAAGALKWMLEDVAQGWNAREQSMGLFANDGSQKPSRLSLAALGDYFASGPVPGNLTIAEEGGELRYTYRAPGAFFAAARRTQDAGLAFAASNPAQVFARWTDGSAISLLSTEAATVQINPRVLLGQPMAPAGYALTRNGATEKSEVAGEIISFSLQPGDSYLLRTQQLTTDAKLEIVWPHDNKPVQLADRANISAYLLRRGELQASCLPPAAPVRLWRSLNNDVEQQVATATTRQVASGVTAWDFNNVNVAAAREPANKYYFRVTVDGVASSGNVWSHGADARTFFPKADAPDGVAAAQGAVDAKIEIVWPHDNLPVDRAIKANIAAFVFQHGSRTSVPVGFDQPVRLWRALNSGVLEEVGAGARTTQVANGVTFPVWLFNNVDVSAARQPLNKYYFRLTVDGVTAFSNIWSHGADARTYFPQIDAVTPCAQ